jgi:hypothetical protein
MVRIHLGVLLSFASNLLVHVAMSVNQRFDMAIFSRYISAERDGYARGRAF